MGEGVGACGWVAWGTDVGYVRKLGGVGGSGLEEGVGSVLVAGKWGKRGRLGCAVALGRGAEERAGRGVCRHGKVGVWLRLG